MTAAVTHMNDKAKQYYVDRLSHSINNDQKMTAAVIYMNDITKQYQVYR